MHAAPLSFCERRFVRIGMDRAKQKWTHSTHHHHHHRLTTTRTTTTGAAAAPPKSASLFSKISSRPIEYASIPCVAAFVGISTNFLGVKMLFYPIEYLGINLYRDDAKPYGFFGWQGVVPTKTEMMAKRLCKIVTERLLSLEEAFGRLDPEQMSQLLLPAVEDTVRRDCGELWYYVLRPVLPMLLTRLLGSMQREIDTVLNLEQVVLGAFVRDKIVLVDLFQKVGRVELEFLINSGFGFGFLLGLGQMVAWVAKPRPWTLPVAGALVGYITNLIAIKLLFEPADPVPVGNLFIIQGLFESRQVEVSDEFGNFMEKRVLSSSSLLEDLASGGDDGDLHAFLRRHLPWFVPSHILSAAVKAVEKVAAHPQDYPELHDYVKRKLSIEDTLSSRLKRLSPTDFEDLLHPVFQEDEITLIATGGVLGLVAGALQTRLGWGGPGATLKAFATIVVTLLSSVALYGVEKYEESQDEPIVSTQRPQLRRKNTMVRQLRKRNTILRIPDDDD